MTTVFNAYEVKQESLGDNYLILFGNREEGWIVTPDEVCEFWAKAIRMSKSRYFGDVTMISSTAMVRSMHNANTKILDKSSFPYLYSSDKISTAKSKHNKDLYLITINGKPINGHISTRFVNNNNNKIDKVLVYVDVNDKTDIWNAKQVYNYIKHKKLYYDVTSSSGWSTKNQYWNEYIIKY